MKNILYATVVAAIVCLAGCENDPYLYRDSSSRLYLGQTTSYGIVDSIVGTFRSVDNAATTMDLEIPVSVTGVTASYDRTFLLEVVPGDGTNVSPSDYVLNPMVVPANVFKFNYKVTVKRQVTGMDITKSPTYARLKLRLVGNENFQLGGYPDSVSFKVVWCDFLTQPATWSNISGYVGAFSQAKYKFIIDVTGETEFSKYRNNYVRLLALQATLKKALMDYNEAHPGAPYLNDNGQPLTIP